MADTYARSMALVRYESAKENRRFAHVMRRWGHPGYFHDWMRKAIRDWQDFKYYSRKEAA